MTWDPYHIATIVAPVVVTIASASALLYLLVVQFAGLTNLQLRSLSLLDLWVLAQSKDDRAEVIKEFYDWQHKLLLAVITGLIGFIAANIVLVVQATVGSSEATKAVAAFLNTRVVGCAFGALLLFLLLLTISLLSRLGRISDEYRISINLYERMR